jgi:RNA polymerase sigma-70 factor, ECF subfamily
MQQPDLSNNYELIAQLRIGDEKTFDAVFKHYYRGLFSFATQYTDQDECEEIVQDVMMWLWENRMMLVPEMSLKSLLFTMVKNKCLNDIEHRLVRNKVHEKLFKMYQEQFDDPDFYVEKELEQKVNKCISELPSEYRKAFELNRFKGLTYHEIASLAEVSEKTIAYRISQSLKILRKELRDYLPTWLFF